MDGTNGAIPDQPEAITAVGMAAMRISTQTSSELETVEALREAL